MAGKLLPFVMRELQARKGQWPKICTDTGLDYSWLTKLAQGDIPDPGVNKIETLAEHFRANPRRSRNSKDDKRLSA